MSSYHLSIDPMLLNEFVTRATALGWVFRPDDENGGFSAKTPRGWINAYEQQCEDGETHIKLCRGGGSDIDDLQSVFRFVDEDTPEYDRLDMSADERSQCIADGGGDPWGLLDDDECEAFIERSEDEEPAVDESQWVWATGLTLNRRID